LSRRFARLLDEVGGRLRRELPELGEVFIDLTSHRSLDSAG